MRVTLFNAPSRLLTGSGLRLRDDHDCAIVTLERRLPLGRPLWPYRDLTWRDFDQHPRHPLRRLLTGSESGPGLLPRSRLHTVVLDRKRSHRLLQVLYPHKLLQRLALLTGISHRPYSSKASARARSPAGVILNSSGFFAPPSSQPRLARDNHSDLSPAIRPTLGLASTARRRYCFSVGTRLMPQPPSGPQPWQPISPR